MILLHGSIALYEGQWPWCRNGFYLGPTCHPNPNFFCHPTHKPLILPHLTFQKICHPHATFLKPHTRIICSYVTFKKIFVTPRVSEFTIYSHFAFTCNSLHTHQNMLKTHAFLGIFANRHPNNFDILPNPSQFHPNPSENCFATPPPKRLKL